MFDRPVECINHQDKSAVRLCDSCDRPFCADCLRKNILGFYYCEHCYPALFKNTSAPEYEIPRDEKRLRTKQIHVESDLKDYPDKESQRTRIIGIIIGFIIFT